MKYIISGIVPGFGGVGKLLEYLNDTVDKNEFTLIYPLIFTLWIILFLKIKSITIAPQQFNTII